MHYSRTVNAVAETAFLYAKPKKLVSDPNKQDMDTSDNTTAQINSFHLNIPQLQKHQHICCHPKDKCNH